MKALKHFFTWWNDRTIGTAFFTFRHGRLVGEDSGGNRYYEHKKNDRRWVIYNGDMEASRVPPEWHGWLHHTDDAIPRPAVNDGDGDSKLKPWQKGHRPNQSGTASAYRPDGSLLGSGQRAHATGDYEAWRPE